jgi:hypothetical protein
VQSGIKRNLLELLDQYRSFNATDLRDKVYALLGLMDPEELPESGIAPNYCKEYKVDNAYADVARVILQTSRNLDLLSVPTTAESSRPHRQLSSWIPDWSSPSEVSTLINLSITDSRLGDSIQTNAGATQADGGFTHPVFSATGSSASNPVFQNEGQTLGLRGYIVDQVDRAGMVTVDSSAGSTPNEGPSSASYMISNLIGLILFQFENSRT